MALACFKLPEFLVERDYDKCINCRVCERQCGWEVHSYDEEVDKMFADTEKCVGCQRCAVMCPTGALVISPHPGRYREHGNWTQEHLRDAIRQSETGGVVLAGSGNDKDYPVYWDKLLLNASQVTNPSIDPLREPMELRTYLGAKPESIEVRDGKLVSQLPPQVQVETPILFSALSYGAISFQAQEALARAAAELGILYNTGEGGLHHDLYRYRGNTIVQVASGRFGVDPDYLNAARIVEIKIGQGAKPGIGGHLPGEKVVGEVSVTRMIPAGTDAISPAPQHDIYSIEDLSMLIYALKEATNYQKPVSVKIAAVHNVAAIATGMVRAGADIIALDGFRGGTGAAPKIIRDNVGIPIEFALAAVDTRLRQEGIRNRASIIAGGGFRNSADVIKAIALGADAVYIGTAALVAMGCTLCQKCYTGICNWGITTQNPYLAKRLNPEIATERLVNLVTGWSHEIKEMLGGLGVNSIESLRGNRLHLRGIGLTHGELETLGVRMVGQ
ncbi:MAG: alpha-hydroxy-acid oxidizing protein [Armatimonadetes bacterium]|nr:alpha-hydroxy-acid oxidizing protein [Armatimonadota bacterium]